jgi:hypothetical protein
MIVLVTYLALYIDNVNLLTYCLCVCSSIQVGGVPVSQLRGVGHVHRLCLLTPCIRQGLQVRPFAHLQDLQYLSKLLGKMGFQIKRNSAICIKLMEVMCQFITLRVVRRS